MINSWTNGTKQCVILADLLLLVLGETISEAALTCLNEVSPTAGRKKKGGKKEWQALTMKWGEGEGAKRN